MIDLTKLTFEQKEIVNEFRKRMEDVESDYLKEDISVFYRFLKARDFDLEKAEKMLRKHINFNKFHQIHSILRDFKPREFFRKYMEPSLLGLDKEGDIIYYIPMGKMDGREWFKCLKMNDYMKHCVWFSEKGRTLIIKVLKQKENAAPQLSFIVDLEELTLTNVTNKQCPSYYVILFSILKAMMSHAMIQKFRVYGQEGWKEKLLKNIDADVLPAFLGGNRTDPDGNPLCRTFVSHFGRIPPCHFLSAEDRDFKDKTLITTICVPKSDKKKINVTVEDEGSLIHWEFLVKHRDIGFGLFFQGSEELVEILPTQRFDTIDGVEVGSFKVKFPGEYVVVFDNSYSWLLSKEIEYCIKVIKPDV